MKKIKDLHKKFLNKNVFTLPIGGLYRYRKTGEEHQHQGKLIHLLQTAVGKNSYELYKKYSNGIHSLPPINLRDLLTFKDKNGVININEVEPIDEFLSVSEVGVCLTERFLLKHMRFLQSE